VATTASQTIFASCIVRPKARANVGRQNRKRTELVAPLIVPHSLHQQPYQIPNHHHGNGGELPAEGLAQEPERTSGEARDGGGLGAQMAKRLARVGKMSPATRLKNSGIH
jgi:hypothetical protein